MMTAAIRSSEMLIKKLKQVLFKQRLVFFVAGVLFTVAVILLAGLGLSFLANIIVLPVWVKITLLCITAVVAGYLFVRFALSRLFTGSVDSVAVTLEEKYPELKGRLVAAVQFARMHTTPGYSRELIDATHQQAIEQAKLLNFNQALTLHPALKAGRIFIVTAIVASLLVVTMPGIFSYSYKVYSNPTTEIAPPLGYKVVPVPGATEWVKYKDITFGAAVFGEDIPKKATVHYRYAGGNWQKEETDLKHNRYLTSEHGDSALCMVTLRQVDRSFDYYVEAGRVKTEMQKVDVVDRPRVTGIKLSLFYPDYTGLSPTVIDENNGSFSAVVGTRVSMNITTNLPIEQAALIFDDSSQLPMAVNNRTAKLSLRVNKSQSYFIRLKNHLGEKNPDPIEYYITAIPDEYPSIDVLSPGFDVNLSDEMILPLKVRIFDDYGFSSLVMKYTVVSRGQPSEEHVAVLHFSERIKTEGDVEFNWDMDKLNLYPGDYVAYYFEIADNDQISGPKVTRSRQYIARLPSLDEIIAETEGESRQRISKTEQLLKQGKELAEHFKKMARKLQAQNKQALKGDWQQKKELEALTKKNEELVKNIEKMADKMEKSIEKINENATMSRKILEKMQQIQKLFQEVATPEMLEAQRKLMEALKKMDRQQIEEAMKQFQMSQEELLKRLERTLTLLKRLQVEQKMEAMIRKAEQLLEQQKNVNTKTERSSKEQLPSLTSNEQEVKSGLEGLKKEVEELRKLMQEAEMESSPEGQEFMKAVEKTDADANMQNMANALQKQQKQQASQEGSSAESKLAEMLDTMQQQLMAMTGDQDDKVKKEMRMAIEDANVLSEKQEKLLRKAAETNTNSMLSREMATTQQDLVSACAGLKKRIAELANATPFIASELQMLINQATQSMELATDGFAARKGGQAVRAQRDAMVNLNKVSLRLMESLDQQNQCDKGSNCNKNISKLESLCNKQNKLNQQCKNQCNNPSFNPSSQSQKAREGLQRLAGEQASIRKSLQELAEEFGQSRQVLGRLEDIAKEMKKVEEDLADGEIGPETTERQLRIYSRMLQASRSLQRKDFTNQRKATTATEQLFAVPPNLPADLLNDRTKLEDRLRRYLGDGYPPQYEEQIKAYFKALLKAESQRNMLQQGGATQ